MWFFKKNAYLISWSYGDSDYIYTELIEARTPAQAWEKIRSRHAIAISLHSIEKVN